MKKRFVFLVLSLLAAIFAVNIQAQQAGGLTCVSDKNEAMHEKYAEFPGGVAALYGFISDNITYPEDALAQKVEGIVVVKFSVDTQGVISNVRVKKNLFPSLDNEAIRIVSIMPKWAPGSILKDNECVPIEQVYTLPVVFNLPENN